MQQVHILSTLESARRPAAQAPSKRRKPRPSTGPILGNWQVKVLIGLMAAGIVSLMTAFVLLLLDKSETQGAAPSQVVAIEVDRHNPLAALVAAPTHSGAMSKPGEPVAPTGQAAQTAQTAQTVQAAVIEELPAGPLAALGQPAAVTPKAATAALLPSPLSTEQAQGMPATQTMAIVAAHVPAHTQPAAAQRDSTAAPAARSSQLDDKPAPKRPPRSAGDDDVALLEAVLAHSATRQPPTTVPVAEEIQQCAKLGGAAAATCRARICVQHPTTPACHQDH